MSKRKSARDKAKGGASNDRLLTRLAEWATILALLVAILALYFQLRTSPPQGKDIIVETSQSATATKQDEPSLLPTPGPTLVPTSSLNKIHYDDFSSPSTGWDNYSSSNTATGYEESRYYIQLSKPMLFLSIWESMGKLDDGVLEVNVLGPFEEGSSQGIGYGWNENWEGSTYAFTINSSGMCKFLEASDGWRVRKSAEIASFNTQQTFHNLKLYIRGNEALGYVDDTFCARYIMPEYKKGYVGVVASPNSIEKRGRYYFDEYRVFESP